MLLSPETQQNTKDQFKDATPERRQCGAHLPLTEGPDRAPPTGPA